MAEESKPERLANEIFEKAYGLSKENSIKVIREELAKIRDDDTRIETENIIYMWGIRGKPQRNRVILLHGIRTHAKWYSIVCEQLEESLDRVVVHTPKYGFFNLLSFLIPVLSIGRRKYILGEMNRIFRDHGTDKIHIIAHSFGTYIISKILINNDIRVDRVIFCGSIVKEAFDWARTNINEKHLLNDCGTKDLLPVLAKSITWGYGASGRLGFNTDYVSNRYHNLGHSGFFTKEFVGKYWAPFLSSGKYVSSEWDTMRPTEPWMVSILSIIKIPIIFIFSALVITKWDLMVSLLLS